MWEIEDEIVSRLKRKYDDFKFYRHNSYRDFIEKKGFFFKKPTGVVIKSNEVNWKRDSYSAKRRSGSFIYDVHATIEYYLDFEHKICLYRFL